MGTLPYFYADHFVYLSIKALPKGGACLDVFFYVIMGISFILGDSFCHKGFGHIFNDDPPSTNGIMVFTGNGIIGPV